MDAEHPDLAAVRALPALPQIPWDGAFAPALQQISRADVRVAAPLGDQPRPGNRPDGGYRVVTHGDHGQAQDFPPPVPLEALGERPDIPDEKAAARPPYNPAGQGGEHANPMGVV